MKYIKVLFFFIVFLQLTDTYKLPLLLIGQTTSTASLATLIMCMTYIAFNFSLFRKLLRQKLFKIWINIIVTLPAFFTTVHFFMYHLDLAEYIYWISFFLFFGSLYVVSAMLVYSEVSNKIVNRLFVFAIIAAIVGFIISAVNYPFILALMSLASNKTNAIESGVTEIQRAVGFFAQANTAAKAIVLYFIFLLGNYFYKFSKKINIIMMILFILMVFWTGSRTSLLIIFFVLIFFAPSILYPKVFNSESKGINLFKVFIILRSVFVAWIGLLILNVFATSIADTQYGELAGRLDFLRNVGDNKNGLSEDVSLNARFEVINDYLFYIAQDFLIGKGPEFRNEMRKSGEFQIGSQNEYLETGLSHGIFYVFYYLYALIVTFNIVGDNKITRKINSGKSIKILVFVIFIYGFSINYIFLERVSVIVFGVLIGMYLRDKEIKINEFRNSSVNYKAI